MFKNIFKKEKEFWNFPKRTYYQEYGRAINLSTGLIAGLFIDKFLFYITKGLSVVIPPFSALLMSKGFVLTTIRFEKDFGKFECIIKHLVK